MPRRQSGGWAWGTCIVHLIVVAGLTALSLFAVPKFADISAAAADDPEAVHPLTEQLLAYHPRGYLLAGAALAGLALLKALLVRSRTLGMLLNIVFVLLIGAWLAALIAGLYLPILGGIEDQVQYRLRKSVAVAQACTGPIGLHGEAYPPAFQTRADHQLHLGQQSANRACLRRDMLAGTGEAQHLSHRAGDPLQTVAEQRVVFCRPQTLVLVSVQISQTLQHSVQGVVYLVGQPRGQLSQGGQVLAVAVGRIPSVAIPMLLLSAIRHLKREVL
jgi:hypothetical protein